MIIHLLSKDNLSTSNLVPFSSMRQQKLSTFASANFVEFCPSLQPDVFYYFDSPSKNAFFTFLLVVHLSKLAFLTCFHLFFHKHQYCGAIYRRTEVRIRSL